MAQKKDWKLGNELVQRLSSDSADIAPAVSRIIDYFSAILPPGSQYSMHLLQARLALSEALANVVHHAYDGELGYNYHVSAKLNADQLVFQIEDNGRPMPDGILDKHDGHDGEDWCGVDKLPEGGFGLSIIAHEMDGIYYRRSFTTNFLTLVKVLTVDEQAAG